MKMGGFKIAAAIALGWAVSVGCANRTTDEEPALMTESETLCSAMCDTHQRCGEETGYEGVPHSECFESCLAKYFAAGVEVCRDVAVPVVNCEAARDCSKWPSTDETGTPCADEKEPFGLCRSAPEIWTGG